MKKRKAQKAYWETIPHSIEPRTIKPQTTKTRWAKDRADRRNTVSNFEGLEFDDTATFRHHFAAVEIEHTSSSMV